MAHLLIVDDDKDSLEVLGRFMQKAGHRVDCVPNGKEAVSIILTRTPDLVILDLFMPEMDGPTLLEVLRSYLRLKSLPVVVLTGEAEGPLADRIRQLKVNTILTKGKATPADLLRAVEQELARVPKTPPPK